MHVASYRSSPGLECAEHCGCGDVVAICGHTHADVPGTRTLCVPSVILPQLLGSRQGHGEGSHRHLVSLPCKGCSITVTKCRRHIPLRSALVIHTEDLMKMPVPCACPPLCACPHEPLQNLSHTGGSYCMPASQARLAMMSNQSCWHLICCSVHERQVGN